MAALIVGIDPGKDGAIAFMSQTGIWVVDTPTLQRSSSGKKGKRQYDEQGMRQSLVDFIDAHSAHGEVMVGVEMTTPRPDEARMTTWAQAMGIGLWKGILIGMQMPFIEVYPQVWKRQLLSGLPKGKAAAYTGASRLYPWLAPKLKGPKGGLKDGRCDAVLIAEYARRKVAAAFTPRANQSAAPAAGAGQLSLVGPGSSGSGA